jgi:hypothetical protein
MNASTPRHPAEPGPAGEPLLPDAEEGMNEVLLGLAWMLAGKVIRTAKAAAAAA